MPHAESMCHASRGPPPEHNSVEHVETTGINTWDVTWCDMIMMMMMMTTTTTMTWTM
jgi:hypothetical protein